MVAVLTEVNALPRTERKFSVSNRYRHGASQNRRFQMGRHIVRPFVVMLIVGIIFRDVFIEIHFKILPDRRIGIFIDRERGRCVLDEHLTNAGADFAYFRKRVNDLARDQVEPAPAFFQVYDLLEYFHG